MSEMTRRAVEEAWSGVGRDREYPNPDALATALDLEATRLDEMIAGETQRLRDQGIARFKGENQGNHPPFLEAVQIGNQARLQSEETVLRQELGEAMDLAAMEDQEDVPDQSWRDSPDRWRTDTDLMDDPTPEIDGLTEEVWPERTIRFRVTAAYLMQTRYEDSQPIPESPTDPLKAQFTVLVDEELERRENVLSGTNG